jgi:hypothetical protein
MLSIEVKKNLNISTAAAVAVVDIERDPDDDPRNRKPGLRLESGNLPDNASSNQETRIPDVLECIREANKISPLLNEFRR